MLFATLALLAGGLFLAPIGSSQSGTPTLSSTPPVALAAPSTTTTTTPSQQLPKTGFETSFLALGGLGLILAGTALRRARPGPGSRRTR